VQRLAAENATKSKNLEHDPIPSKRIMLSRRAAQPCCVPGPEMVAGESYRGPRNVAQWSKIEQASGTIRKLTLRAKCAFMHQRGFELPAIPVVFRLSAQSFAEFRKLARPLSII
jgi:hypothetical protein